MKTKTKSQSKEESIKSLRNLVKGEEEQENSFEEAMEKVWNPQI